MSSFRSTRCCIHKTRVALPHPARQRMYLHAELSIRSLIATEYSRRNSRHRESVTCLLRLLHKFQLQLKTMQSGLDFDKPNELSFQLHHSTDDCQQGPLQHCKSFQEKTTSYKYFLRRQCRWLKISTTSRRSMLSVYYEPAKFCCQILQVPTFFGWSWDNLGQLGMLITCVQSYQFRIMPPF